MDVSEADCDWNKIGADCGGSAAECHRSVICTARVSLVLAVVLLLVSGCGHSDSYDLGHEKAAYKPFAEQMVNQLNESPAQVCADLYETAQLDYTIADKSDFLSGCRDGLESVLK